MLLETARCFAKANTCEEHKNLPQEITVHMPLSDKTSRLHMHLFLDQRLKILTKKTLWRLKPVKPHPLEVEIISRDKVV